MRALRWHGVRDVRLDQVPTPQPRPGQVLIRVERVGLCGSDLEEFREGPVSIPPERAPLILGHEIVGTVVDSHATSAEIGTRAIPDVVVGCGHCWWCQRHDEGLCPDLSVRGQTQDGGLADYMIADAATCVSVPGDLDVNIAAFAEPTAVAVRALRKSGDLAGAAVTIIGGGTVGNLIAQITLAGPASSVLVIDPVSHRRALAAATGAATAEPSMADERQHDLTDGRGADVVFECSGVPTGPTQAVQLSRRGATIVLVGFRPQTLHLPWLEVVLGERHLIGTAAHLWDVDVAAGIALLSRGTVDPRPLHTDTVGLSDAVQAFERLDTDPSTVKLLVAPTDHIPIAQCSSWPVLPPTSTRHSNGML